MAQGNDSVRVVIFNKAQPDLFLILTETDDPDNWKLPGGRFDDEDEQPMAAARREVREELGLNDVVLTVTSQLTNDDGVSNRYIFQLSVDEAEVQPTAEIARTRWVTVDTIPEGKNRGHILSAVQTTA